MSKLHEVLSRLDKKETRAGGGFLVSCPNPGHGKGQGDKNPSLWIWENPNGRIGLKCFSNCDFKDIVKAFGDKYGIPQDYFGANDRFKPGEKPLKPALKLSPAVKLGDTVKIGGEQYHFEDEYQYTDEAGKPLFYSLKFRNISNPDDKTFRLATKKNGQYSFNIEGVRRVLYRLPAVLEAVANDEPIIITEGEKDVNSLLRLGFNATTNPNGANGWKDDYTEFLAGATVFIIPDNDQAGEKWLTSVYNSLRNKAKSIRVLRIPREFKDVSDWISAGATAKDIENLKKDLPALLKPRSVTEFLHDAETQKEGLKSGFAELDRFIRYKPAGTHIIAGRPGVGKTTVMLNILLKMVELYPEKTFVFLSYEVNEFDLETKAIMNLAGVVLDQHKNFEAYQALFAGKYETPPPEKAKAIDDAFQKFWDYAKQGRIIVRYIQHNIDDLERAIKDMAQYYDLGAIFIDYIQKIKIDRAGRTLSRQVQLQEISGRLLEISNDTNTPLILGAQLNRVAADDTKAPTMANLRESGDIEQDAATIVMLYRNNEDRSELFFSIEKNRFGKANETGKLYIDEVTSGIQGKKTISF
jgi:5S rRNA maturation endonuclease (ribonuclease M5)